MIHRSPSVTRAATAMGVATLVSRLLGFVRVLVIAAVLGTTYLGNTFQAANSVSNVLFELLAAGALSAVLVPTFVRLVDANISQDARTSQEAQDLAGSLLGLALIVLGVVSVVGVLAAPWLARILTSGARADVAHQQRELAAFLLRFFVPQVVLYAAGAIAIAVLQAHRRFSITALAPIGNTVMTVTFLIAFQVVRHGAAPSLHLNLVAKMCLAASGTLGVMAFVGIPLVALWRSGFHLRPRIRFDDRHLRDVLMLSAWGVLQHAGTGLLLGAALIVGNGIGGGVVGYQTAYVFFLVPYAVIAQPIHTAILPEMAADVARGDLAGVGLAMRWALHAMAVLVLPAAALLVVLAHPLLKIVAFGHTRGSGIGLIAGGLAGLAAGLPVYGAFLLLSRAYYALGDSRTPALASIAAATLGAAVMAVVAPRFGGSARVAAMGLSHSAAYLLASALLTTGLRRRTGVPVLAPSIVVLIGAAAAAGAVAWLIVRLADPTGRAVTALVAIGAAGVAAGLYLAVARHHAPARVPVPAVA
jgi:putative peptidoglycan lipid II flippase